MNRNRFQDEPKWKKSWERARQFEKRTSHAPVMKLVASGKSFWRMNRKEIWEFYCPSCRMHRKVPFRSRPGGRRQIMRILAATAFLTLCFWPWFEWKGVVTALPLWTGFEIYFRTHVRANLNCTNCGFDAYLYLVDIQKARQGIDAHWRGKFAVRGISYPDSLNSTVSSSNSLASSTTHQTMHSAAHSPVESKTSSSLFHDASPTRPPLKNKLDDTRI